MREAVIKEHGKHGVSVGRFGRARKRAPRGGPDSDAPQWAPLEQFLRQQRRKVLNRVGLIFPSDQKRVIGLNDNQVIDS